VAIRRKLWDALCLLVERRGALVSAEELRDAVWRGVQVGEGSVGTLLYDLRRVLDDPAAEPRYIETVPARGFRMLATVEESARDPEPSGFVGRAGELRKLTELWARVKRGERQLALLVGEAGIGKTELIDQFCQRVVRVDVAARRLVGRCLARQGEAEAYLPVFDMLDAWWQLAPATERQSIADLLREQAPRWARQLTWLGRGRGSGLMSAADVRPARMMREITSVFEVAAAQRPLIVVFEDLHWADRATVDLVAYLASRSTAAQLLILGSYRRAEAGGSDHPVAQLRGAPRDRTTLLELQRLPREEVLHCLQEVFDGDRALAGTLLEETLRRSGGNPLFIRALVRLFVENGCVERVDDGWRIHPKRALSHLGAPLEVATVVGEQLHRLTPQQRELLEVAAVAGDEFDAAAVAGAMGTDVETTDTALREQVVCPALIDEVNVSTWPDGTTAGRFRFSHALYREVLYRGVPSARRARLHRKIGLSIECGFAAAPQVVVPSLAEHFELGGDHARAADYLERAALQMIERSAIREAAGFFGRALRRVLLLPVSAERLVREVRIRHGYGLSVGLAEGLDAPGVRESYDAVDRLRHQITDPDVLFPVLRVFWVFELLRFGYDQMQELTRQLHVVATASGSPAYRSLAASLAGTTHVFLGQLPEARENLEASLTLCDDAASLPIPAVWLTDARVETRCVLAWVLWLMGFPAESQRRRAEAQRIAEAGRDENSRGLVLWFRSSLAQLDHDVPATRRAADQLHALGEESGMAAWQQIATIVVALADLMDGDPSGLEQGLASLAAAEGNPTVVIARAYLLGQLAMAYGERDAPAQGLALVDMALARIAENHARVSEADLLRIRGELLERQGEVEAADAAYRQAIEVARGQAARSFELRAASARLAMRQKQKSARRLVTAARTELAQIYATFGDGVATHDLRQARKLLDASSQ